MSKLLAICVVGLAAISALSVGPREPALVDVLFVDPAKGDDSASGTRDRPLKTISAALALVPDPLERSMTIELAAGTYSTTGGHGMPPKSLHLMRRMRPGVEVRIRGTGKDGRAALLAWSGDDRMVEAREGRWTLENVRLGSFERTQRRGLMVSGACDVLLRDVEIRLRSNSDAGIYACRGGRVALRGRIRLNDLAEDELKDESFCGVIATDQGIVEFDEREGSALVLGNGSLSASYWGSIRLGCESARITSRSKSNALTVCNSGRIDLRNTTTTLCATDPKNTPIGLEHDGHVLAEDALITIEGRNDSAIALQKASTLTCNDIALKGDFEYALWASSGSMFVGRFVTDAGKLEATTGASIHVEKLAGKIGDVTAKSGGVVSLPDRVVTSR